MKRWWQNLDSKVAALSQRERLAVFFAGLALGGFLLNALLLEPIARKIHLAQSTIESNSTQVAELQQQIEKLHADGIDTLNAKRQQELTTLKAKLDMASQQLNAITNGLVKPDEMLGLIEQLMKNNARVKLVALNTLPISTLQDELQKTTNTTGVNASVGSGIPLIYRHGTEIVLEGGYLDLLQYVADLEQLPWKLIWGDMRFKVNAPGIVELTLQLHTLSQEQAWLSL